MAGIGAPIRPSHRFVTASPMPGLLPRRLRLGCSALALLAGLAALGAWTEPARADGAKIVGMRLVRGDSSATSGGGASSGGGNGAGSNSAVGRALSRAASAGTPKALFDGMRLNRIQNASANNPVVDAANRLMTIEQLKPKAVIDWDRFNIAGGETVKFDQKGNRDWAVLNRIGQADPSRVDGALKADGHVYLINQNGVIFGNGARVNVRNLVASSLKISEDQFTRGILDIQRDSQQKPLPTFAAEGSGEPGQIRVERGALIEGPDNGSVMLLGGSVVNAGTIRAPAGQVVIGAGRRIYVSGASAAPQGETYPRGLAIEVDALHDPDSPTADRVVNTGTIDTPRGGNISIASLLIDQNGRLSATTAVQAGGSIQLKAAADPNYDSSSGSLQLRQAHGKVTFGRGSRTTILPENSAESITDAQAFEPSKVQVIAGAATMERGAEIRAPAGDVGIEIASSTFDDSPNRFTMERSSRIDVSGTTSTEVAMERNQIAITLRNNELNSPLQRDGFLFAKSVNVDVREGSPIGSIDGYLQSVGRTAVERSAVGGTVSITSDNKSRIGEVVIRDGATIDVSGGQVRYRGGWLDTTQLVGADGRIYDISEATPDIQYVAFAEQRFGQQNFYGPRWEAGYTDGMAAGSVTITTGAAVLDGRIVGQTTAGARQRARDQLPALGSLKLNLTGAVDVTFRSGGSGLPDGFGPGDALPEDLRDWLVLDPSLVGAAGMDRIAVTTRGGDIEVPTGTTLRTAPGGSVELRSQPLLGAPPSLYEVEALLDGFGDITVAGAIETPSGTIRMGGRNITLAAGARLTARGQWVNDTIDDRGNPYPGGTGAVGAALPDGGTIDLSALEKLTISGGSLIDVSAGGWVAADGSLTKGDGGSVLLATSRYSDPARETPFAIRPSKGELVLDGEIRGYGLDRGGKLTIRTDRIWIGGGMAPAGALVLDPGFLSRGGFGDVTLQGYRGVTVARGAVVTPAAAALQLNPDYLRRISGSDVFGFGRLEVLPEDLRPAGSLTLIARGSSLAADDYYGVDSNGQPAPDNPLEGGGSIVFGQGSVVRMGMGGSVTAVAARLVQVDGTIETPAGQISLTGGASLDSKEFTSPDGLSNWTGAAYDPGAGIRIGATGQLLARGAVKLDPTFDGTRRGTVLDGGTISLRANNGALIIDRGALLDVSGVATDIDLRSMTMYGLKLRSQTIASNGGTIRLASSEGLFVDGTLLGRGGGAGAGAEGGTLITELRQRDQNAGNRGGLPIDFIRVLNVRQTGSSPAAASYDADTLRRYAGRGFVAADTVMGGGFGTWVMGSDNVVNFNGDVTVKLGREIQIAAPTISATPAPGRSGSRVVLQAPLVTFRSGDEALGTGQVFAPGQIVSPATQLSILADLIDINGSNLRLGGLYQFPTGEFDPITGEAIYANRSFTGFKQVRFESRGDIRFTGGRLDSAGDMVFKAAQLYPTTGQNFTIQTPGKVTVLPNGKADIPLSIGGALTIESPEIVQNGTIRAPLGRIVLGLEGSVDPTKLTLGRGSLTSVSADGLTAPYGYVQNGSLWFGATGTTIATPPAKEVRLRGTDVTVAEGAVIDMRGGGELLASEFVPGLGGPIDVLDDPNGFAVIPDYDGYASWDPYISGLRSSGSPAANFNQDVPVADSTATVAGQYLAQGSKTTLRVGDRVYLSGGGGLPAGTYVLLPARYALMPGAYRVRAFDGILDMLPKMNGRAPDGSAYVAGRASVLNTSISDARWSGFHIESGEVLRQRAQYDEYEANSFFQSEAFLTRRQTDGLFTPTPTLPIDGGTLVANATETLRLDGTGRFAPAEGGRLGRFDVAAAKVAVVSATTDTTGLKDQGYLLLQAGQLNDFGIGSLMIGGERSTAPVTATDPRGGTRVTVSASDVVVRNEGTPLEAAEILLTASNAVTVESGSVIRTAGTDAGQGDTLRFSGTSSNGALLRLSTGDRVDVVRQSISDSGAALTIQEGAAVLASGSLTLDSTGDTVLATSQIAGGRAIDAAARQISFGDAPAGTPGLVFRDGTLGVLAQTGMLTLHSYGSIDFHGDVTIGAGQGAALQTLSLDGRALIGHGGNATINAGAVRLRNTGDSYDLAVSPAGGSLTINATTRVEDGRPVAGSGRIDLADGPVRIAGFGATTLSADERIVGTSGLGTATDLAPGTSSENRLKADGSLTLNAAALSAGAGSDNRIEATGDLSFQGRAAPDLPGFDQIGGRLRLSGDTVTLAGRIEARAGILEAAAAHDLLIAHGTTIDAAGVARTFFDQTRYAPGGTVKLSSAAGDVVLAGGAGIAIGGGPGGDAGRLIVDAAHGRFRADGMIDAHSADGTRQGQVDLDLGGLDRSFDDLAGRLAAAGFAEAQRLRIRNGSVTLGTAIRAREFALSVDGGDLDIRGSIDASGATGGDIHLAAGGMLTLETGAVLNASGAAIDAAGKGGSVLLAAGDDGRLDLKSGSVIAVGAGGDTGTVHLRAPRTDGDADVAITQVGSGIAGARQVTVEAYKIYETSVITGSIIRTDLDDFAEKNAADRIEDRLGAGVAAKAGVELRSDGDMTLAQDLDLYALLRNGDGTRLEPGILTLRAGGDLTFKGNLSDGFTTVAGKSVLQGGDSWSYRLVAGADATGADPLALRAAADLLRNPANPERRKGSVVADTVAARRPLTIRTGTGDIDVAAAVDVVLGARTDTNSTQPAMIYTAGRPIGTGEQPGFNDRPGGATYPTEGGDITIAARGSLYGVPQAQLVTDYVKVQGDADGTDANGTSLQTSWWIDVDGFRQGVGALGGGNVTLRAGGDIRNLSAVIPTVGWVSGPAASGQVNIRNGGSLTVDALGDIVSGVYYVGRGDATIESGGAIKGGASISASRTYAPRTILAVGDAPFRLRSRGDLTIETALDPMLLPGRTVGFFSRGANGAVSLDSIGGDVRLGNDGRTVAGLTGQGAADSGNLRMVLLYPSALRATSFGGDITIDGGMVLVGADRGTMELLAADDVLFRPQGDPAERRTPYPLGYVAMADALPQFEPTPQNPLDPTQIIVQSTGEAADFMNAHLIGSSRANNQASRHVGDRDPARIYAAGGDVRYEGTDPVGIYQVIVPKSLGLRAGSDIADLSISVTNTNADDVSLVQAGRDIDLATGTGKVVNIPTQAGVLLGGPGRLEVGAGRNIDLGYGFGILTDGNLRSPSLPEQGADIAVLAGLGSNQPQDLAGFLARYLDPARYAELEEYLRAGDGSSIYTAPMIATVEALTGRAGLDAATAFALFRALPPQQQDPLLRDILFAELRASGREANDASSPRFGATDRGYAAAGAMFPGDGYAGGITMRDSQIKTQRGGDISILVPGGGIQLGAIALESGREGKDANDSGLWTVLGGDIRVFAQDDILIRSSRALTASGGSILMWSSFGDIDAGIGSRSAVATAAPLVRLSPNGTLQVEPPRIISGSGIGALRPPGDVDLYAPNGVVDAGEGGIRVAGNFNVFALQVLNADNIQVGGQTVGLPTAPVNPASISGVSDVAAQATRAIEESVREQAQRGAQPSTEPPPLLITGSFLGYEGQGG